MSKLLETLVKSSLEQQELIGERFYFLKGKTIFLKNGIKGIVYKTLEAVVDERFEENDKDPFGHYILALPSLLKDCVHFGKLYKARRKYSLRKEWRQKYMAIKEGSTFRALKSDAQNTPDNEDNTLLINSDSNFSTT